MPASDHLIFLKRVEGASAPAEVAAYLFHEISQQGFTALGMGWMPEDEHGRSHWQSVGMPSEYLKRYAAGRYERYSPVVRRMAKTTEAFSWHEVTADKRTDPTGHRVFGEAREFGIKFGWSLPVFRQQRLQGWISIQSDRELRSVPDLPCLQLLALWAHEHADRLLRLTTGGGSLTGREREVLQWLAVGKTYEEIGFLCGLSARTIEHYIANAGEKLGTLNRVHTIAEAIRLNEIKV